MSDISQRFSIKGAAMTIESGPLDVDASLYLSADGEPIHIGDRLINVNHPQDVLVCFGYASTPGYILVYGGHAVFWSRYCRLVGRS